MNTEGIYSKYTSSYQNKMVTLFALSWGLLFLDRMSISFLFPILVPAFHLNNFQVGVITMSTSLTFAIFSFLIPFFAERTPYRKRWLVPTLILAALFSGLTAITNIFAMLLLVRFLTGIFEGPAYPLMNSMMKSDTDPRRFALYTGMIAIGADVITAIFGPFICTQLAAIFGWRIAFVFTSIPAIIVAIILAFVVKEVGVSGGGNGEAAQVDKINMRDIGSILSNRNGYLSLILLILTFIPLWTATTYGPLFWTDPHIGGLTLKQMGYWMSLLGVFGVIWAILCPKISDYIGRRWASIIFSALVAVPSILMTFSHSRFTLVVQTILFAICTFITFFYMAVIPGESLPKKVLATATGLFQGAGEIIGSAAALPFLGWIGDVYGLPAVFKVAAASSILAAIVSFFLIETAPRFIAKKKAADTTNTSASA